MHRMAAAALASVLGTQPSLDSPRGCGGPMPPAQPLAQGPPVSAPPAPASKGTDLFEEPLDAGTRTVKSLGPVAVGAPFPTFRGWTLGDESYGSRDLLSGAPPPKAAVVSYFATWCAPCRKGLPHIEKIVASDPQVNGVLISLDGPDDEHKIAPFLAGLGVSMPTLWDKFRTIAQRHGLVSDGETLAIPKTFVLEGDGTVHAIFAEEGDDFAARLSAAVEEAKKGDG